jgi:hemerythrin
MGIDWSPELTLNHELLDREHVELFRRLEEAAGAVDGPRAGLDAAVAALTTALIDHLATEERLMEATLYPERVRHRSAHELFLADFDRMRAELREAGPTPAVAEWLRTRLPEWLRFHVRVNDLPFGAYLARRRPAPTLDARARRRDGGRLS